MKNYIQCSNVRISEIEIAELDKGKPFILIPRAQVENISLRYGTSANHPLAQVIIGILTIGLGFIFLIPVKRWFIQRVNFVSGRGLAMLGSAAVIWLILGLWLISEVLRKRYYLYINTRNGFQKISFALGTGISEINQFIRDAVQYGYYIKKD